MLPPWADSLLAALGNTDLPRYARLFIAKVGVCQCGAAHMSCICTLALRHGTATITVCDECDVCACPAQAIIHFELRHAEASSTAAAQSPEQVQVRLEREHDKLAGWKERKCWLAAESGTCLAQGGDGTTASPPLSVFGHFAGRCMAPLVETIVGDEEEAATHGMNYLVLDMCTMLLRWTPLFPRLHSDTPDKRLPPEWAPAAQHLVNHIVSLGSTR